MFFAKMSQIRGRGGVGGKGGRLGVWEVGGRGLGWADEHTALHLAHTFDW